MNQNNQTRKCEKCSALFTTSEEWWSSVYCSKDCFEAGLARERGKVLGIYWCRIPDLYHGTIRERIPCLAGYDAVQSFTESDPDSEFWLYVHGPTGTGKSRAIVDLGGKLVWDYARSADGLRIIRGTEFQNEVVERSRPREKGEPYPGRLKDFIESLQDLEVLIFEEISNMRFTEKAESEFFDLLEHRAGHKLCTIFVADCDLRTLSKKMSPAKAPQIIRRIKENSVIIEFTRPTKAKAKSQINLITVNTPEHEHQEQEQQQEKATVTGQ